MAAGFSCRGRYRASTAAGGATGSGDTWEWDGKNWTQIKSTTSPLGRHLHAMAYDSARQRTVLFGGNKALTTTSLGDTWAWDGKVWTLMKPTNPPRRRWSHGMAYDSNRRRTVLFGGTTWIPFKPPILSDTWEWGKATLTASTPTVSISKGGTQQFALDAGTQHGARFYWLFGSVTGVAPGFTLGGLHFPLNLDFYTDFTIAFPNTGILINTRSKLDANGRGTAVLNVPKGLPIPLNLTLHHAYLVYDAQGRWHMVSNPVLLTLVK